MSAVYEKAESISLLRSGSSYFDAYCKVIDGAQKTLHLQTYIFESDETGKRVIQHLISAARRGVKIFLLLDGYGSKDLRKEDADLMKNAGITLRYFSPVSVKSAFRVGRRLHHKILVADDRVAIIGGINISNHYSGNNLEAAWLDFALYIEGNICIRLSRICMSLFNRRYIPSASVPVQQSIATSNVFLRFRQSDYMRGKKEISRSYKEFVRKAEKEIIIVNAYFLPGYRLRRLFQKAAARGVKITVILAGKSDVPLMKRAMNYYYAWLFRNNISIYEYQTSNLHAKLAVFDDSIVTIGSFNLNYLSEYVSVELNVDVNNTSFATSVKQELLHIIQSECIKPDNSFNSYSNPLRQFIDFMSYQFIMYAMRLLYIITRKDRINILK